MSISIEFIKKIQVIGQFIGHQEWVHWKKHIVINLASNWVFHWKSNWASAVDSGGWKNVNHWKVIKKSLKSHWASNWASKVGSQGLRGIWKVKRLNGDWIIINPFTHFLFKQTLWTQYAINCLITNPFTQCFYKQILWTQYATNCLITNPFTN